MSKFISNQLLIFFSFVIVSNCEYPFTILHTNDVHARFVSFNSRQRPCEQGDLEVNDCYGGAARRMTAIRKFKEQDPNVLLLDAGDQFQGTLWYTALKWEPIAAYMNVMNYDAMAFGNHEFDDGINGLEPFVRNLTTPILNSNIEDHGSPLKDLYQTKIIKEIGGQKIGIVGCTTTDTPAVSKPGPDLEFHDEIRSLQPIIDDMLASGINKIIVLSHSGITVDRQLCQHLKGVDIVVGGHSHTLLYSGKPPAGDEPEGPYPEVYANDGGANCLVIQDFAYGKYLGRLKVTFDDQGILREWSENNPVLLDADTYPEDKEIADLLDPYNSQLEHFQQTVVAKSAVALDGTRKSCRSRECNLGNVLADAAVNLYTARKLEAPRNKSDTSWSYAAIAIWNGGGVRDYECLAGENVTLGDLYTIMPFQNTMDKITIKGVHLLEAFEYSVADYDPSELDGKFLQVSGVNVVYDLTKPNGQRVKRIRVLCHDCGVPLYEDLQMEKVYSVVMPTFISEGGDGYVMIKNNTIENDSSMMLDMDVVMAYMEVYQPILSSEQLRIQFDDGTGKISSAPFVCFGNSNSNCSFLEKKR